MKKIIFTLALGLLFSLNNYAQNGPLWRGKLCAVVLTYDDAIDQHLDNAVPLLDSLGLKATFYITAYSISMQKRMDEWRKLATRGYELGNHTDPPVAYGAAPVQSPWRRLRVPD